MSNAAPHAELDRRRPSPDWMEPNRPSAPIAADSGVAFGGTSGVENAEPVDATRSSMNEWAQAKSSFTSLFAEADAVVGMFDQQKKHIVGLTQALSNIQESFDKLHTRFSDIESRVEAFENISGRLSYRVESTFDAVQECKTNEAELAKNDAALRTALAGAEQAWSRHADSIRTLAEENRALREALKATDRDNKLIVAEIANVHAKIALLEQEVETETLFVNTEAGLPRSTPIRPKQIAAVPHAPHLPQSVPQEPALPNPGDAEFDKQVAELNDSIEFHRGELARMQLQAENLMARFAVADGPAPRPATGRTEPNKPAAKADIAASSRAASKNKLAELKALSSSYQTLVQDLEEVRARR